MPLRGCLVLALILVLIGALGGILLLSAAAAFLTGQNTSLGDAPPCVSAQDVQQCPAPNEVAARVIDWAERIANHLYVTQTCGSTRSFPNCYYTYPDANFPQAITAYAHRLCDGLTGGAMTDCSTAWAINQTDAGVVPGRFQCVSLVRGAYSQVYPMNLTNNAFQLWATYSHVKGWKEIAADPRAAQEKPRGMPLPGDAVIIWRDSDTDAGHTAIITKVGAPNAQGDRVVTFVQANSNARYDQFILHKDFSATLNWPGNVKVYGYLRPDLPVEPRPSGNYSILGKPTMSADFINQILAQANSPAAGKGKALYDLGVKYGIDPVYALAFFQHESSFGTAGVARLTLSLGNMRCMNGYACYHDNQNGDYALFESWEQGFEAWYHLMRDQYVNTWHLDTIEAIIPKYAPVADHNNEKAYIASVERAVDNWRAGKM